MVDSDHGTTDDMPLASGRDGILEQKIDNLSTSVDQRFALVDRRFEAIDRRFDDVDKQFQQVTEALVEQRQYTEFAFEQLRTEMRTGFTQLDRKLDRVLDTLTGTGAPPRRRKSRSRS